MLDPIFDPIFRLIGGARQLPLYLFLLPIPILLWLFWAEYRAATGRDSPFAEKVVHFVDGLNSAIGKTFGWCILILTFTTAYEVFSRYVFRAPTEWAFDASYMLYGTLFMMAGAYALARNAHVRGDFIYRAWSPRKQAMMDMVLYFLFFFPGMIAFVYAGFGFAELSRRMNEHSSASPNGPIVWPFKWLIIDRRLPHGHPGGRRAVPLPDLHSHRGVAQAPARRRGARKGHPGGGRAAEGRRRR